MFRLSRCAAALLLMAAAACAAQPEKFIRLRNERISTPPPTAAAANRPADAGAINGLCLLQFESAPTDAQRQQLAALGVELITYVPDDAFIAEARAVAPGKLRALEFVRWFGPFRAEHKLHGKLAGPAARPSAPATRLDVSVLLAPRANAKDDAAARRHFARVDGESKLRQGTILRGSIPASELTALADSAAVLWIEPAPRMKLQDEIATKIVAGDDGNAATLATVHQLGYTGAGVKVSVADSGLDSGDLYDMHPDLAGRVTALFHYGALEDAADEHSHGTHCAGIVAGNGATGEVDANGFLYGLGVAPGANIIAQRIFDGLGGYTYTNASFEKLTRDAKLAGADIGSNSWGDDTQGRYDLSAMEFDALVRDAVSDAFAAGDQPYILEFSAGNAGPGAQTIGSPAVAKNVIATGAAQNDRPDLLIYGDGADAMADFSSRGPCEDGRIKPDITAPGTWIASLRSVYADDNNAWGEISERYMFQGGTSQAGPHASGAAAVIVQWWRSSHTNATPSPALVKAALINSATDMDETAIGSTTLDENGDLIDVGFPQDANPVPNHDEGWGRVDLPNLIGSPRNYLFVDQSQLLTNGQVFETSVLVGATNEPLKITLAYTDVPGSPAALAALVNDLDLEVLGPDGNTYHGNQFIAGESIANPAAFDTINNIEAVHLRQPTPGEYLVRVKARNIPMDARRDTAPIDQDFALVASATFETPGVGIVTFDRRIYNAPRTMNLRLVDYNLAGQPTANLTLRSTTETNGESLTLQAYGTSGTFTGALATATSVGAGTLQVQHNDTITALYQDASPAAQRSATARADLQAPVSSGVFTTNRFGKAEIHWSTDEPASSILLYGTNASLGFARTNDALATTHTEIIPNQIGGRTYYYRIVSTDEAGNRGTNNPAGPPLQFIAPFAPNILLVDETYDELIGAPLLTDYTAALDELGLDYDVWNADPAVDGSPTLTDLAPFRIVLWRLPELSLAKPALSAAEIAALTQYVNGGGGLFIASMEALSRLDSYAGSAGANFRRNVLHVADGYTVDAGTLAIDEVPNDAIGDGVNFEAEHLTYLVDGTDLITPQSGAKGVLRDADTGGFVGLSYPSVGVDSPGRVVFFAMTLDTIPTDAPAPGNRATVLRRVLTFLAPGLNGEGSVTFNQNAYNVPSQANLEVADSDLSGLGQVTINIASQVDTNGFGLTLTETIRRGVFRGSLALVPTNSGGSLPELRVAPGGYVRATYFDASLNLPVIAQVIVETNPPVVTAVSSEPGYVDAVITWQTDERADSLVEFGESPRLGRTAYDSAHTFDHALTLPQLAPERTYYYRIISTDQAGNTSIAPSNGVSLYQLTTLAPLRPDWTDNLENSGTNWTVYTVADSEHGWELGPPGSTLLPFPAHSFTNAWGSNLKLDFASQIETYLISPAILLTGGNTFTLNFWHQYDFTPKSENDILEAAELLIVTNNAANPISLAVFADATDDWTNAVVDLTPYQGQVVYLAWHYFLFSLDAAPRLGWLIDDVSVTTTTNATGTLIVSNNLWQSSFNLDGAPHQGPLLLVNQAAAGLHTVMFNPVPFYNTPAPQTNTLTTGGTNIFLGNYTFTDANTNGISDAWELARFGSVSPARTKTTDTDHDGMSDYAEFIAGTDPNGGALTPFSLTAQLSGTNLLLSWPTQPGWNYRVIHSTTPTALAPLSPWISAGSTSTNYLAPLTGSARMFQVEATNPSTSLNDVLKVTITPQSNALRLDWNAVTNRGYRVWNSTNVSIWAPLSAWLAGSNNTVITKPTNSAAVYYRLEVAP